MDTAERRATAALWSIQGVGPKTLAEVRKRAGPVAELLEKPVCVWAPLIPWRRDSYAHVMSLECLAPVADKVEQACRAHEVRILFSGDPAFPSQLETIPDAPPLLFAFGPVCDAPPRRRLAFVGTRRISGELLDKAEQIAGEAAYNGLGIISGGATGVDQAAHRGALAAQGETWAFLGCALDEIDSGQRWITQKILEAGGSVLSEFPPGFRANKSSFNRRNRLISGASDAVLVYRAPKPSGALNTAEFALEQGRPLLATIADPWSEVAEGSNELILLGKAKPHVGLENLMEAVGLVGSLSPALPVPGDLSELSPLASQVLRQLRRGAADFEGLLCAMSGPTSGELSAALVELEVFGAVVHKGGRRYEKR